MLYRTAKTTHNVRIFNTVPETGTCPPAVRAFTELSGRHTQSPTSELFPGRHGSIQILQAQRL